MRSLTSLSLPLILLTPLAAAAAPPSHPAVESSVLWTSGVYQYDGAGNIRAIGADTYVYDSAGRLVRGSADKQRTGADNVQSYVYDSFGNMQSIQTAGANCAGNVDCGAAVTVSHATNHLTSDAAAYDDAGNLRTIGATYQYAWDPTGMMVSQSGGSPLVRNYIYTASDERLATRAGTAWQWTLRDEANRVVRVLTSTDPQNGTPGTTNWQWSEDNVFAAGRLAASVGPYGRRHYHTDHLGSPRLVTDDYGRRLADHAYYPYGAALNLPSETPEQRLKFTGHERDVMADVHALDYMHARYYWAGGGRFLSMDPAAPDMSHPQEWNAYVYATHNPVGKVDPDGRIAETLIPKIANVLTIEYFYLERSKDKAVQQWEVVKKMASRITDISISFEAKMQAEKTTVHAGAEIAIDTHVENGKQNVKIELDSGVDAGPIHGTFGTKTWNVDGRTGKKISEDGKGPSMKVEPEHDTDAKKKAEEKTDKGAKKPTFTFSGGPWPTGISDAIYQDLPDSLKITGAFWKDTFNTMLNAMEIYAGP